MPFYLALSPYLFHTSIVFCILSFIDCLRFFACCRGVACQVWQNDKKGGSVHITKTSIYENKFIKNISVSSLMVRAIMYV